jgi:acetoin utilization protein AcuB
MKVSTYMHRDLITVAADAPLSEAKRVMEENGFGLLLIVDQDRTLKGFITKGALKEVTDWTIPAEKACFEARFAVSPQDTLEKAALILIQNRLALLPVVDAGHLVGVITQGEILLALSRALGIGVEGTRLTVRIRNDTDDLYKALAVLRDHGAHLISVAQGEGNDTHRHMILRVQGVQDKEKLRHDLEAALTADA